MFNNINNNSYLYGDSQLGNASNIINLANIRSNLHRSGYASSAYVDSSEISSDAMKLLQKDLDIKKFTDIATSNQEDKSYIERVQKLFSEGIVDVFEDDVLKDLVNNQKLWGDLNS